METKSFKQMIQAGEIKRADAMKVRLDDIHEEIGFNLRQEGEDLEASIDALAAHINSGGTVPALEVRPRPGGGVFVVDGHRRRRAFVKARNAGAPIEWVSVVAFTGNDADRVTRIITSAEGRALSPLEVAKGYKRLLAFGLMPDEIAAKVGKTRQHVDQLMILANANTDVQRMVAAGGVSAAIAVKVAREHGENAGQVLQQELDKAKAAGKAKVTDGTIKGKSLPVKVVDELVASTAELVQQLPIETVQILEKARTHPNPFAAHMVSVPAGFLLDMVNASKSAKDAREEQEAKAREKAAKASQG